MSFLFGGQKKQEPQTSEVTYSFEKDPAESASSVLGLAGGDSAPKFDIAELHPLAGLGKDIEYLNLEDESLTELPGAHGIIPIKDWTDDLCYGTGAIYLTGLGLGGAYGFAEGMRKTADSTSARLRLNGVLNAITRRGPFLGNSAGVLAMTYNLINSSIGHFRGQHDELNSLAAGALAGAVFKATKGVRQMAIASGLMTGAAGVWCLLKRSLF